MVRYQRLQFYGVSFSMKMVDARGQDTTGSNFIEVRYGKIPRLQFYRGSFSMKMVDARVQDTTGSNFIEVRYGKIPKVAIL